MLAQVTPSAASLVVAAVVIRIVVVVVVVVHCAYRLYVCHQNLCLYDTTQPVELASVGHKDTAIRVLHEVLSSRRFRAAWQKPLEDIAKRYIDLCTEKRRAKDAKDGLYQFRSICHTGNSASLEDVVRYFLNGSEARATAARTRATEENAAAAASPAPVTPEAAFLNSINGETSADRKDRALVTPWLKYLW
jgi:translation initiation factor 3 subunit A